MARYDDDEEDRPRRRSRRDDDFDDEPQPRRRSRVDDDVRRPKPKSNVVLILGIVGGILLLCCGGGGVAIYFISQKVSTTTEQVVSSNNLKEMGLGIANYEAANGGFPTNSYSPDGKPLLSWRVHLLPHTGHAPLYQRFNLKEPWDGPTNKKLLDEMPLMYATAKERGGGRRSNRTYYRGFSNPGTFFGPPTGVAPGWINPAAQRDVPVGHRVANITDGTANTIAVVEAGDPIEWTKPDDLDASPGRPFPAIGGPFPKSETANVLMVNGEVRALRKLDLEAIWRPMSTIAGGEVVNPR